MEDDSLVFTGIFSNVNYGDGGFYNTKPLTLKSKGVQYLLELVTYANNTSEKEGEFVGEIVYTAIPKYIKRGD